VGQRNHDHGLVADGDDHAVGDGERERQGEREGGSPCPDRDSIVMRPPRSLTFWRTTSMPTPRPEMLDTCLCGGEAGREDQVVDLLAGKLRVGRDQPFSIAFWQHPRAVDAGAVVETRSGSGPSAARPTDAACPRRSCRGTGGTSALFDAVVDRVADEVGQRLAEAFDYGLVELGASPAMVRTDVLAGDWVSARARCAARG
jgi:hypothetical protein